MRDPVRHRQQADDGQAVFAALMVVVVAVLVLIGAAHLAARVVADQHAQAAADAAALAGAIAAVDGGPTAGRSAAAAIADRNGADLVSYLVSDVDGGQTITVVVRYAGETARAAASTAP